MKHLLHSLLPAACVRNSLRLSVRSVCAAAHVVLLSFLLLSAPIYAQQATDTTQTRPVDLRADSLYGTIEDGQSVRHLVGNVQLQQDETRLWAHHATQYVARDEILFTGHVRIVERGDSLWADRVLYDSQRKIGRALGNVHLTDGEVNVYAPSGRYFTEEKRTEFTEGVRLIDSTTVLTSRAGTYWSDEKRADFYDNVRLEEPHTLMVADSVTYYREREVSRAHGNVAIERLGESEADSTTRTFVFGQSVYNDESAGYSRVEGQPLLMQLRTDTTADSAQVDTLLIRARRIETARTDSLRRLVATDSVRIWQKDLAAVADSALYDRHELGGDSTREETRLFQQPMAWARTSQIHADTLRLKGRNGSVDTLFARTNAFAAQLDTTLQRVQQLRGRHITGLFVRDSLRQLTAGPNAESIYYLKGENDAPDGAARVSGDRIIFTFRGDALERLRVLSGVEGIRYPEGQIPSPFQLEGYRWVPERRPTKAELLQAIPPQPFDTAPPPLLPLPEEPPARLPAPARETNGHQPEARPDAVDQYHRGLSARF